MTSIVSSYFIEVPRDEDVDLEIQKFWEDLEKVSKTFSQSIEANKSKIVNKISSKLEVLKSEISFSYKNNLQNTTLLTRLAFLRSIWL
jgi:hypothetical protein